MYMHSSINTLFEFDVILLYNCLCKTMIPIWINRRTNYAENTPRNLYTTDA